MLFVCCGCAKSHSQQKLANKISHFTIKFRSKNLIHFTNLNLLNIVKNILPQHSQKAYSPYKFSTLQHVSGFQKKHLHSNISRSPRTAFSKNLSGGGLNNFFKATRCLGLVKCFKIFHFN